MKLLNKVGAAALRRLCSGRGRRAATPSSALAAPQGASTSSQTFLISDLKQRPELWHPFMFHGQLNHGCHKITVPDKLAEELKRAGHTLPASVEPDLEPPSGRGSRAATPAQTNHWPLWAKLLRLLAVNRDAGLGDILARLLEFVGGNLYKKWHLRKYGRPCKCGANQTRLNSRFPLPKQPANNVVKKVG